jgi:hypothetical protein
LSEIGQFPPLDSRFEAKLVQKLFYRKNHEVPKLQTLFRNRQHPFAFWEEALGKIEQGSKTESMHFKLTKRTQAATSATGN